MLFTPVSTFLVSIAISFPLRFTGIISSQSIPITIFKNIPISTREEEEEKRIGKFEPTLFILVHESSNRTAVVIIIFQFSTVPASPRRDIALLGLVPIGGEGEGEGGREEEEEERGGEVMIGPRDIIILSACLRNPEISAVADIIE